MSIIRVICLWALLIVSVSADDFANLLGELSLPVSDGWIVSDSYDYPFQIIHATGEAELLIFKSVISPEERITDNYALKRSVDKVLEDAILSLPEAQLLANTGLFDKNRLLFTLDFTSVDTLAHQTIFHRLMGIIYQHPDGHQLLFTLWGKRNALAPESFMDEIVFMQNNAEYTGLSTAYIYGEQQANKWIYVIGVLFVVVVLLLFFSQKKGKEAVEFSADSNFWRCDCGRQNHNEQVYCRRCGKANKFPVKF